MSIYLSPKRRMKLAFERITGQKLLPRQASGIDFARDIKHYLPGFEVRLIFDVGANIGQTALQYVQQFPAATIHSFEPSHSIYDKLTEFTANEKRIVCHRVALGKEPQASQTFVEKNLVSHLAEPEEDISAKRTELVDVDTLELFCEKNGVSEINLLKIDTEGHDLQVLQGSDGLFRAGKVDLAIVEAGLNPLNNHHVSLRAFLDWFEERGYFLFGLYEQTHEFSGEPQLRRSNIAFVSPRLRETYRHLHTSE